MATPLVIGVGAIAAALAGRQLLKSGAFGAKRGADQWVKGGFRAKMDRKEAVAILGLKYVSLLLVSATTSLDLLFATMSLTLDLFR